MPNKSNQESYPQSQQPEQLPVQPDIGPAAEVLPTQEQEKPSQQEAIDKDDSVVLPYVQDDDSDDSAATIQSQAPSSGQAQNQPTSPAVADDLDVIEKAWVDRAKQIIKDTRDNPRAQEEQFEQLQIEYHKKRYGRDIKAKR